MTQGLKRLTYYPLDRRTIKFVEKKETRPTMGINLRQPNVTTSWTIEQ